jgi:hypothetical protein
MAEGTSNSLINLGDLSKPADTLVKKISKAVGGIFQPYQIKRVAKAEAEASLIKAEAEIQITDLQRRAMNRFVEEEAQRQKNIEEITAKALPQLSDSAKPESIEDDWLTNFFDKCRIVSDQEMQSLWSRVLASEANMPGRFSRRTVNFLSDLDKTDAEMFSKLCGFSCVFFGPTILMFRYEDKIYQENGITFASLAHLESIGLISYNIISTFHKTALPKTVIVSYYGDTLKLSIPPGGDFKFETGKVLLTKVGKELAQICNANPVTGFLDYLRMRWKAHLSEEPSIILSSHAPEAVKIETSTAEPLPPVYL